MKYFFLLLTIVAVNGPVNGQIADTDSLKLLLERSQPDTNRVQLLLDLGYAYYFIQPDISLTYSDSAASLSRQLNFVKGEITALNNAGESLRFLGDYPRSLRVQFRALELARKVRNTEAEAISLGFIGFTYTEFKEYRQGLAYLFLSRNTNRELKQQLKETFDLTNIGNVYDLLGMPDSALYYQQLSYKTYTGLTHGPLRSLILTRLGNAFFRMGKKDSALKYYHTGLENARRVNDRVNNSKIERKLAELYKSNSQYDSSLYYAKLSFIDGKQSLQRLELLETSELLVSLFLQNRNTDSAFFYQGFAKAMTDSLYGPRKFKELQLLMLEEQQRQQEIQQAQERYKNNAKMIALLSAVAVFLVIAFLLYRNNRHKQKTNKVLEQTLSNLKATQSQLIQSEKMASLGELTAGIAHEIQNPLNFVNNFSDVNKELADELEQEIDKGNYTDAKTIAKDIKDNEEKINHHGKRADAIVKGMLQHSRSSTGQKEPTDVNALCDEYLRLAYHGLRAKDKSFNTTTKTDFDNSLGNINVIPQDIGRVILNLINNAFYAVDEKKKKSVDSYEPVVTVSTKNVKSPLGIFGVEIIIADNGNGIPPKVLDKIFQPFFTTKPTGQGTGLGLSLSYDIVKAHGGELKVNTKENEGTEFTINLPASS